MAQRTRHLTSDEIDRIISDILDDAPELRSREEKVANLRKIMLDKNILVNITTELANIIGSEASPADKLDTIFAVLSRKSQLIPEIVSDINNIMTGNLDESERLEAAIAYIGSNSIFSEEEMSKIIEAIVVHPYDYRELVISFMEEISMDNPYGAEIKQIYDANFSNPDLLLETLSFYVPQARSKLYQGDTREYTEILDKLERLINGSGKIYDAFRISKIFELPFVAKNDDVSRILTSTEPTPELKIFRLVEYLRGHQNLDVPEWLIQLLEGKMNVFIKVRSNYAKLIEKLSVSEKDDSLSLSSSLGGGPNKLGEKEVIEMIKEITDVIAESPDIKSRIEKFEEILKDHQYGGNRQAQLVGMGYPSREEINNLIGMSSELVESATLAARVFQDYLESSNVVGSKKFDSVTLLEVMGLMKTDGISTDFRNRALRATLEEVEISDLDKFVNDYKLNRPRYLNNEEIRYILSSLPSPMGDKDIAASSRQSMGLTLQQHLRDIKITPLAIDDLRERIKSRFNQARQIDGQPVGVQAASGMGAMVTQMTLNTFHAAGSALNVTSGIERTNELINVKKDPKSASTTIYYEPKLTFDEAREIMTSSVKPGPEITKNIGYTFDEMLNKRSEVVGITVADLFVGEPEIDRYESILSTIPRWYDYYNAINGTETPVSTWVMRLRLNPLIMYKYKISVEDVAGAITSGTWMDADICQAVQCINVVYGPNGIGLTDSDEMIITDGGKAKRVQIPVIDIFPVENLLNQVLKDIPFSAPKNSFNFLNRIVEPSFKSIYIQGVNMIKQAFVEKFQVWDAVSHFRKTSSTLWTIYIKETKSKQTGVNNTHVARLCWSAGMIVKSLSEDGLELKVSIPSESSGDPGSLVSSAVSNDMNDASNYQEERISKKIVPSRRPSTEVSSAAYYYYIATIGSNLRRILTIPGVDARTTFSNHPAEDAAVFGIESGRNYQLMELVRVFSQDGDLPINLRHVLLLTDFMTVHGELVPLTYGGMGRQSVGFMTKATYEHAMTALSSAALSQAKEKVEGVSVSITVGQLAKIGSGAVDIVIDRDKIKDQMAMIDDLVIDEKAFGQMFKDRNAVDANPMSLDLVSDNLDFDDYDFEGENYDGGISDKGRFADLGDFGGTQISTNPIPTDSDQYRPSMLVGDEFASSIKTFSTGPSAPINPVNVASTDTGVSPQSQPGSVIMPNINNLL